MMLIELLQDEWLLYKKVLGRRRYIVLSSLAATYKTNLKDLLTLKNHINLLYQQRILTNRNCANGLKKNNMD